jgi:hypothetical protein
VIRPVSLTETDTVEFLTVPEEDVTVLLSTALVFSAEACGLPEAVVVMLVSTAVMFSVEA